MKYRDAIKQLKFKKLNRFVLSGSEPYLKESFIYAAQKFNPDVEFLNFYPESPGISSLLYSSTLFEERIVVIRNAEELKEQVYKVLSNSKDIIILVLSENANLKSKNISKITIRFESVECNRMRSFGNDFPLWINSKISEAGYELEDDVDKIIYERTGPRMFVISNELKKLYLYKNEDKTISKKDVQKVVSETSESNTYDILDRLLQRDISGALSCFKRYNKFHDNYLELVAFFAKYLEKLYRILLFREQGMTADDMAEVLNIPRFLVKIKYMPRAISYGKKALSKCLEHIEALDINMRLFKGDKKILMENFILKFVE